MVKRDELIQGHKLLSVKLALNLYGIIFFMENSMDNMEFNFWLFHYRPLVFMQYCLMVEEN